MRMAGFAFLTAVNCVALVCFAQAQGAARTGNVVAGLDQRIGGAAVSASQRQQALTLASALRDILERDPAIATPARYSLRIHRAFGRRSDWANFDSGLPFYAGAYATFFEAQVKPSPTSFSEPDFGIYVNTVLQCPMMEFTPPGSAQPWSVAADQPVVQGGRRTGEIHGFAIYDGQCAIAGRSKEPPFLPLTHQQFLTLQIGVMKDRLKNVPSTQNADPAVRDAIESATRQINEAIANMQQDLARMTAAERQAPATVQTGNARADLADTGDPDAIPLSVPNPAFFDHSLPGSTIQSVAVFLPFLQPGERAAGLPSGLPDEWRPTAEKIRDGLDWEALKRLLQTQ